jgi:hypothetical protein
MNGDIRPGGDQLFDDGMTQALSATGDEDAFAG